MLAPNPHLPADVKQSDLDDPTDDARPTFDDWWSFDAEGFGKAIYAAFEDDYGAMIADAISSGSVTALRDKMQKRLDAEIEERRGWVNDWRQRRGLRVMY